MHATTSTSTTDEQSRRRRVVWATLTLAIALSTIAVSATGAVFTETDTVGSNAFTTGTVSLDQTLPSSTIVTAGNMAPGATATGRVEVTNTGSLELRYAVTSTTTGDQILASQLDLWVWDEAAEADSAGANATCDATPGTTDPATYLYTQGVLGSASETKVIGDAAQGPHTGDRVLPAASREVLCFHVELPKSTGDAFQGLTTTATFTFESEQTANNA